MKRFSILDGLVLVLSGLVPVGLLALGAMAPAAAHADECVPDLERALSSSDAVFEGIIRERAEEGEGVSLTFEVVQTWKGADQERLVVTTRQPHFEVGSSYLVFAIETGGSLSIRPCSRTVPIGEAGEDLAVLGGGVTPVDITAADQPEPDDEQDTVPTVDASSAGCRSCAVGADRRALASWWPWVFVALWFARRRVRTV